MNNQKLTSIADKTVKRMEMNEKLFRTLFESPKPYFPFTAAHFKLGMDFIEDLYELESEYRFGFFDEEETFEHYIEGVRETMEKIKTFRTLYFDAKSKHDEMYPAV